VTSLVTLLRDFIANYVTSEEHRFVFFAVQGKKTHLHHTISAKNWLIVYHLPTNAKMCLGYFQKNCYCDVTSGYRRYPIFCPFMRNAF